MARYKMTVIFDIHEDEEKRVEELRQLKNEKQNNPDKFGVPNAAITAPNAREKWFEYFTNPPIDERRLRELEHDALIDGSYFLRNVMDALFKAGAFPYDEYQMPMYRTTCEITSCERLEGE